MLKKIANLREFSGGLLVRIWCFHGCGQGSKIPQVMQCSKKKKKKKERQKGKFTNLNTKLVDVLKGNGTFGLYFLLNKKNLQLLDHCLLYNVKNLCP